MKILVFADLHYYSGTEPKFDTSKKLVQYADAMLQALIKKAEEEKVDFVVNLGDSIQDNNDKEGDKESLRLVFERQKAFPCPCYTVLGNHDMKMMDSKKEVEAILGYETTYSFDRGGYHFVFLTTDVDTEKDFLRGGIHRTWVLPEKTLRWLEIDLEKNTLPCILFTHFALAEDESITDECLFLKNRNEVKAVLARHDNIKAAICGHQHIGRVHKEGGIPYYLIASPTAAEEDAPGVPCGAYAILETEGEEVTVLEKRIRL